MKRHRPYLILISSILFFAPSFASASSLTEGRDYDVADVQAQNDDGLHVIASVRTNNTRINSTSSITVTDNGKVIFGPATREDSAWTERIAAPGKGLHALRAECGATNSTPVFCRLETDQRHAGP
ncbi:MAG TPA: hypothetical protein VGC51_00825 [Hansschlegelia sp.]